MASPFFQNVPEISARDEKLALALATGLGQVEAAAAAGVTDRTVRNKLKNRAFRAVLRRMTDEVNAVTLRGLSGLGTEAVAELRALLRDEDAKVRLGAIKTILANVVRLGGYADLAARMAEIETGLRERDHE